MINYIISEITREITSRCLVAYFNHIKLYFDYWAPD